MTFASKYRPRTFEQLVGQKSTTVFLKAMIAKEKIPTALLFEGVRGAGKTSAARVFSAALNCEIDGTEPCGDCSSCLEALSSTSLDLVEIDAASQGGVDDIRALQELISHEPYGKYRVVVLDEAHGLTRFASNALLKTLEEPPPRTVFILISTDKNKIMDTILSRCMSFNFRRASTQDTVDRLLGICASENLNAQLSLLKYLAEESQGSLREALTSLEQASLVGVASLDDYLELRGHRGNAEAILRSVVSGSYDDIFSSVQLSLESLSISDVIAQISSVLKDLLVLHCGGELPYEGVFLESRTFLKNSISPRQCVAMMKILWDLKIKARPSEGTSGYLDLAIVSLTESIQGRSKPQAPLEGISERPLSVSEMKKVLKS